jgi:hypothetical protein
LVTVSGSNAILLPAQSTYLSDRGIAVYFGANRHYGSVEFEMSGAGPSAMGVLRHVLNIGIVASCFGIFVSLSDFILSPKAKERIEGFIDELTLRLDYTKTIDWLQNWLRTTRRMAIARGVVKVLTVLLDVGIFVFAEMQVPSDLPKEWKLLWRICIVLVFVVIGFRQTKRPQIDPKLFKLLAEAPSYSVLFRLYFKNFIAASVIFLLLSFMSAVYLRGGSLRGTSFWVLFYTAVVGIIWISLIADITVTLVVALGLFIARYSIEGLKWLIWKISSYPKGPLTATLTLVGASLAVLKMFIGK